MTTTPSYRHHDRDAAIQADNLAAACPGSGGPPSLPLGELLEAVKIIDAHIDANTGTDYLAQPLALTWARVTKVCEEAGEVWAALSKLTGENPRKGVCGTEDELLGELGDTVSAGLCAIQHVTKNPAVTWAVVSAALIKARRRVAEYAAPAGEGAGGG